MALPEAVLPVTTFVGCAAFAATFAGAFFATLLVGAFFATRFVLDTTLSSSDSEESEAERFLADVAGASLTFPVGPKFGKLRFCERTTRTLWTNEYLVVDALLDRS